MLSTCLTSSNLVARDHACAAILPDSGFLVLVLGIALAAIVSKLAADRF